MGKNILKSRDDPEPVILIQQADPNSETSPKFILDEKSSCTWVKPGEEFGPEKIRHRIEPWLTALCQSDHFSLLLGSGLSNAVHYLATGDLFSGMQSVDFGTENELINIEAKKSAEAAWRENGNIEDQIRAADELLRGLEILGIVDTETKRRADALQEKLNAVLANFSNSILAGENRLINTDESKRELAFNYLVSFLMSFASRTGTRDRLHIFTTNYDRFIEAGAEIAGLHLLDRFVGSLAPIFRSSRLDIDMHYNPPGIRGEPRYLEGVSRFTKLHGSIDWMNSARNIRRISLPFGANEFNNYFLAYGRGEISARQLMIYPNSAKDRETSFYPYVELFRDLAAAACRPNHTLVTFGYSFGDEHINRVIDDMLTIPSTHLVIISYDDPLGRIMKIFEKIGKHAQISLLIGSHIGEFKSLVDHYLPKPAIDKTSYKMAELLKSRYEPNQSNDESPIVHSTAIEGGPQ